MRDMAGQKGGFGVHRSHPLAASRMLQEGGYLSRPAGCDFRTTGVKKNPYGWWAKADKLAAEIKGGSNANT